MLERKQGKVNPKNVQVIDSAFVNTHPEFAHLYDHRNDIRPNESFKQSIARDGVLFRPLISVYNKIKFFVDGNKRGMAAQELGLEELVVDVIEYDEQLIRDVKVAANEQRTENDIRTRLKLALAYLRLDETGVPTGLTVQDTAVRFNTSYEHMNNWILFSKAPTWLLDMLDNEEITETTASQLLKASISKTKEQTYLQGTVDEPKLKESVSAFIKENPTGRKKGSGGDRKSSTAQADKKKAKPSNDLMRHWLSQVPEAHQIIAIVLKTVLGDITPAEARTISGGTLGYIVDEVPAKPKVEKVKKEKGVKDSEINAVPQAELPSLDSIPTIDDEFQQLA